MKNKKIFKNLISMATAAMLFVPAVMPYEKITTEQTSKSVVQFIEAEAANYSTGTYQINTSSGCNVRKGAGTGYAKLGAAANGTQFKVTKVSGNWGYGTIKCTNGTKTGWVCLTYCKAVTSYVTPLASGTSYYISPACATGNNLDVCSARKSNSTNIISYKKSTNKNQQFRAELKSNGYYAFYDVNSGKVIDVSGGKIANGTNVQIYQWNGTDAQLWRLIDAGNGYYYMQSKLNSSYYLDINGGVSSNGANVQLYRGNNSNAQRFKFTKVNNPIPSPNDNSTKKIANFSNSYNYAKKYWNTRNANYSYHKGKNCANFVSQCLVAGGIPTNSTWKNNSYAFVNCNGLKEYFKTKYGITYTSGTSNIKQGDVIYTNNGGHVMFVMKVDNNYIYASGNTNNDDCIKISKHSKVIHGVLHTSSLYK